MVVSRQINRLKNELLSIKAEIAELKRKPTSSFPIEIQCQFGQELKNIRQEVSSLQKRFTDLPTVTPIIKFPETREPGTQVNTPTTSVTVTTWNCRGVKNAVPYLHHLIENDSDIIAITEHWLWPCQLHMLQNIHPDYDGFGFSDNRLHENTDLIRGCGGVGIIWKKSLSVSPVTNISSDRLCAVRLSVHDDPENVCSITILCVYLPSSDHPTDRHTHTRQLL